MKLLVLNGSPKGNESDTLKLTRSFLDGMNEVRKNEITYINVIDKHIEYCRGCLTCMQNGGTCVYDDDMADILQRILASDLLLFSFPLYGFGVPAPLKALLDRTLPLGKLAMKKVGDRYEHIAQADFSHLKYCVISGCGFPHAIHNFEALRMQFELRFPGGLYMLTVPQAPLLSVPEAKDVTAPYLELVKRAGAEYAQLGSVGNELAAALAVPMIPEDVYAAICSGNMSKET